MKAPSKEEQPGPPFNQMTVLLDFSIFLLSISQKNKFPLLFESTGICLAWSAKQTFRYPAVDGYYPAYIAGAVASLRPGRDCTL
jgi:hypothetical protein